VLAAGVAEIADVHQDPEYALGGVAHAITFRGIVAVPMLRDGQPIGAIAVARLQAGRFPSRQVEVLKSFADQAVIAIENVRLFQELEARTADLTRSVGELRALGEVSQAVSSTLDLDAVLETIVSRAVELSGSYSGIVYEFDEAAQEFHARATHRVTPEYLEILRGAPIRLGEGAMGRAGVIREPVEVADIDAERQLVAPQLRGVLARQGIRSLLALPLAREERLLGGLVILRSERAAFSPAVVATLRTFASQSVLAIHNAGLFREIQRQKQYSDALVQTSPVAIVTMDLDGKVVGWNPGAERLFGYTQTEALHQTMENLVATPEVRDEIRANIRQTLGGEWIRAIGQRADVFPAGFSASPFALALTEHVDSEEDARAGSAKGARHEDQIGIQPAEGRDGGLYVEGRCHERLGEDHRRARERQADPGAGKSRAQQAAAAEREQQGDPRNGGRQHHRKLDDRFDDPPGTGAVMRQHPSERCSATDHQDEAGRGRGDRQSDRRTHERVGEPLQQLAGRRREQETQHREHDEQEQEPGENPHGRRPCDPHGGVAAVPSRRWGLHGLGQGRNPASRNAAAPAAELTRSIHWRARSRLGAFFKTAIGYSAVTFSSGGMVTT
jgi:PAS domain S-box-containing protein